MDINRKAGGRGLSSDPRFKGIRPFEKKVWLSSPTMHGEELAFIREAYGANWMSTVGENIDVIEKTAAAYIGRKHAVALGTGTAALHLAVKLAAERATGEDIAALQKILKRMERCQGNPKK